MPTHTNTITPDRPLSLRDQIKSCPSPKRLETLLSQARAATDMSPKARRKIEEAAEDRRKELDAIATKRRARSKKKGGEE